VSKARETEGDLAALGRAERVRGTAECSKCGGDVLVDTGDPTFPSLARWAEQAIAGAIDVLCEECAETADEKEADAARADRRDQMIQSSKIPKIFRVAFADVDGKSEPVVAAAREWAAYGGGLVLLGPVGRGKTFLAGAAAMERMWRGPVRWLSTPALLAGLRAGYGTDEQKQAAQALTPQRDLALVLDDLDKARPTEASLETLFLAIDRWVSQEYPLLVTTNWTLDEVSERWEGSYGPAIASRLAGYCRIVHVKGPDRRIER
jgi:DNA replication protein DnaC